MIYIGMFALVVLYLVLSIMMVKTLQRRKQPKSLELKLSTPQFVEQIEMLEENTKYEKLAITKTFVSRGQVASNMIIISKGPHSGQKTRHSPLKAMRTK